MANETSANGMVRPRSCPLSTNFVREPDLSGKYAFRSVRDLEGAQEVLGALRDAGVYIALDDFGTSYSSLYHLRNFKIDKLKIDRSFVASMERDPEGAAFVAALLGLGHGLGLTVTAEGVERSSQAAALLERGCEQGQGFLYGRAMPAADTIH
jgi:EAL domain-containing protein (putative c-di-GMP-specific phosphodiesterase class I)